MYCLASGANPTEFWNLPLVFIPPGALLWSCPVISKHAGARRALHGQWIVMQPLSRLVQKTLQLALREVPRILITSHHNCFRTNHGNHFGPLAPTHFPKRSSGASPKGTQKARASTHQRATPNVEAAAGGTNPSSTCTGECLCLCPSLPMCIRVYMRVCMCMCMCMCICACICIRVEACVCACMHMY